jgi:FAD/FMN-containing dehydrogenase
MQSYSNFSIGGSVSENCHGRYVGKGPVVNSVRALRFITADGVIRELSRDESPELFSAVIGGYGGLGVVTEVELTLDANERIERLVVEVPLRDYPRFFREEVLADSATLLHNADLVPPDFDAPLAISWRRSDAPLTNEAALIPRDLAYANQQNLLWLASELPVGDVLRARLHSAPLLRQPAVVWRNHEASLDADALEPRTRLFSTYLLQEYFVPLAVFSPFVTAMRGILRAHPEANVLNVSIRHSPPDTTSVLRWAREEVFCFVLYHKQRSHEHAEAASQRWTRALIDAALALGGTYYLPYRRHATPDQFRKAYPSVGEFAAIKAKIDPQRRFRNALWDQYLPG